MPTNSSRILAQDFFIAIAGALAGVGWREAFGWWSRAPALKIYELVVRHSDANDVLLVMGTDALFALGCGLIAAELFIRLARPNRYRPEAIIVATFLIALFTAGQLGGEGAAFLLHLPPLWVTLLCFGIRVGYGIKAERKRLASNV